VLFIRRAHLPDDEEYYYLADASVKLLNDQPFDDPEKARGRMIRTMKKALTLVDEAYEVEEIEGYVFPEN
jgi:hypothetical protein